MAKKPPKTLVASDATRIDYTSANKAAAEHGFKSPGTLGLWHHYDSAMVPKPQPNKIKNKIYPVQNDLD